MAALAIHGLAAPAAAVPFRSSTGLVAPEATIEFSELGLAADTVITNEYAAFGVTFSPNLYQNPQPFVAPNIDLSPNSLSNFSFSGGSMVPVFSIRFSSVQTAAAFAMITNAGTSLFEALLGNTVVDSGSFLTDTVSPINFYGFSGVAFDEIRVTPGGVNNAMILDHLQIGGGTPIPEPSTLLLMLLASTVALLAHRARRKA